MKKISLASLLRFFKKTTKKNTPKKSREKTFTAIEINNDGFSIVELSIGKKKPKLKSCQFVHNENEKIRQALIQELIERRSINTKNCSLVLSPNDYKLLLADAPPISLNDLKVVMPNKIKDSLPWDLQESTNDVIELPKDAFRGRKKSVYVASARTSKVQAQVEMLHEIGVKPQSVAITEIAILGYGSFLRQDPQLSYGILRLSETEGIINMVCDQTIYLTRRLNISLSDLTETNVDRQEFFDQLVLEIQRSVDFYESQMGKGAVSRIQLLPVPIDLGVGYEYVNQNISTEMEWFDPYDLVETELEISIKDKAHCTSVFGEAMRLMM